MLAAIAHFVHKRFLLLLAGSYVVAAVLPGLGLSIRSVRFGTLTLFGQETHVSLPMLMLSLLLFNAGLGVQTRELRHLLRRPFVLGVGLLIKLFIPLGFIWCISHTLRLWHNPTEVQHILVGLALIVAMPIAGSSTAWTQNANGDMTLSLALVLSSNFLGPLTTYVAFDAVEQMAQGEYVDILEGLETTGQSLMFWVIVPSVLGIVSRFFIGDRRMAAIKPLVKLINSVNLVLLVYSNAATCLPKTIQNPDWDFLAIILIITVALCVLTFGAGWLVARLLRVDHAQKAALLFGLGMNNNGTALVLAAMALPRYPEVMLPVIFYNLIQHLVAGSVDFRLSRAIAATTPAHNDERLPE